MTDPDGAAAFDEILRTVMQKPLDHAVAELRDILGSQHPSPAELGDRLTAAHRSLEVVSTRVGEIRQYLNWWTTTTSAEVQHLRARIDQAESRRDEQGERLHRTLRRWLLALTVAFLAMTTALTFVILLT